MQFEIRPFEERLRIHSRTTRLNKTPVNFLVALKDGANYYSAFLLHINKSHFFEFVEFMHPQKQIKRDFFFKKISECFSSKPKF